MKLLQGDCLELMKDIPDESVDMVLTDPPYGMAFQSGYRTIRYEKIKGDFAPKTEFIILFHKGRRLINGKRDPNVFEYSKTRNELHPTQKPVDMTEYMLSKFSDKGDIILDPFMGSGTTGIACKNLNRNFIGMELEENYFNIAKERIENHEEAHT